MSLDDKPRPCQAAIMATWPDFQAWLGVVDKEHAKLAIKERTGVLSFTEFRTSMIAAGAWEGCKRAFQRETEWTFGRKR